MTQDAQQVRPIRSKLGKDGQTRLVTWSDFARNGKVYADALIAGETLVVLMHSQPFAIVRPIDPADIQITVTETANVREGNPNE